MIIQGTIAHVGHTQSPGDVQRMIEALTWCAAHNIDFINTKNDIVELRDGRDFLLEKLEYEVVVLHFLFRGGFTIDPSGNGNRQLAYSEHTSWSVWRHRLVNTKAKLIFAFGGVSEIGGSYIANLDNYITHKVQPEFWIFQKQ